MWKKYNLLFVISSLIFTLGFISLLSVSPNHARSQLLYFLVGVLGYLLISRIHYKYLLYFWKQLYALNLGLLIFTFVAGRAAGGSLRWLSLAGFTFQPSEFAKLILVISMAGFLGQRENFVSTFSGLLKVCLIFAPYFGLVFLQPDLGTALVLLITFVGLIFTFGVNKYLFFFGLFLVGSLSDPLWSMLRDYQRNRILVFLNPQLDKLGAGYNVSQALIAVGSGNLTGKGFGRGSQSHLEFLPAYWTDFVFASYAEEWGFVGVTFLLLLFMTFLFGVLYIFVRISNLEAKILVLGFFFVFFAQFFINIGMNLGIMPVTGIPLPFMTYGGSALIVNMLMVGLIHSAYSSKDSGTF